MSHVRSLPFKCDAVVSDVDGTLITSDKILSPSTRSAAERLRAKGIAFSIISSRPPRGLRSLIKALEITAPVAGFNGGAVATVDLAVASVLLIPSEIARQTAEMLEARRVDVWAFSGQDWLVRRPDGPYVDLEKRTVGFAPTIVNDFGPALETAAKIVGVSRDFELLVRCERELRILLAGAASVVRSQPCYLDVTHPLANKGDALVSLAKLLLVPVTEIATIGDGHNDIAMFERSGLSIAMGNASPEVQRAADFVTDSNNEDGFARAIDRLILGGRGLSSHREPANAGDGA